MVDWLAGWLVDRSGALGSGRAGGRAWQQAGEGVLWGRWAARRGGGGGREVVLLDSCCRRTFLFCFDLRCCCFVFFLHCRDGASFSHHVVLQGVYLRGVLLAAQHLVVFVFGGQRVVDVEGVVLLGGGLHWVLQLVLGIRIVLPKRGSEGVREGEELSGWGGQRVSLEPRQEHVHFGKVSTQFFNPNFLR